MLTLSSDADAVGVAIGARRPIMHHSVHGNHCRRLLRLTEQTTALVRVGVLIRQPVMFPSFMFKKWIPDFTLILPEVGHWRTVLLVAQLELVAVPEAGAPPIGWNWVVAAPGPKPDPAAAGPGAGAVRTPRSPAAILSQEVRGQLHAETLKAVLPRSTLCPVQRRTFLGLTEERVVVVAAPQLLAGVVVGVLQTNTHTYIYINGKRINSNTETKLTFTQTAAEEPQQCGNLLKILIKLQILTL